MPRPHTLSPVLALAAAVAVSGSLSGCQSHEAAKGRDQELPAVAAEVLTVHGSETARTTTVSGTVKARFNATLSAKAMGRVVSVAVRDGDSVRQGQTLLTVDGRELEAALNMAGANHRASVVGIGSARTAAEIEAKTSDARIAQAEFQVRQAEAALASAIARYDLAVSGTRKQEVAQSRIAVVQAESSLKLAKTELDRTTRLVDAGAVARRDLDMAQNRYDLAKGQYEAALQAENLAREGSRTQDVKAAEEAVNQARAAVNGAKAGLVQARAAALQTQVRRKDVEVARAQERQAAAAVASARVSLSYAQVVAPFDGRVVQRLVDPGTMAAPGTPLLAVEGGGFLFEAVVPERTVRSLPLGTVAMVTVDALDRPVTGRVVETAPQGDASTHTFVVKFLLEGSPGLKSGMFAKAAVRTGSAKGIVVPLKATWQRDGLQFVYVVNDEGRARLRLVTLASGPGPEVEVLTGLAEGDRIIVGDRTGIVDGVSVKADGR
ncbi:MAG: efflux RND transporter periplasmic adaptor subunit [Armatimonadetes bacterium]|nr:efflux RND transporter periplasmic adaptor subunit [Armatimonadota bacterium]